MTGGPRTIAETIKVELPEGFQTAEFMLEHGFANMIVHGQDLRSEIACLTDYCQKMSLSMTPVLIHT